MSKILVRWTPFALGRLDEIHDFIVQKAGSTSPANNLIDRIFSRTDQLKVFPLSGQEDILLIQRGIKCHYLVEGHYKIIYEYIEDRNLVVILDVFHTDRDPENILKQ